MGFAEKSQCHAKLTGFHLSRCNCCPTPNASFHGGRATHPTIFRSIASHMESTVAIHSFHRTDYWLYTACIRECDFNQESHNNWRWITPCQRYKGGSQWNYESGFPRSIVWRICYILCLLLCFIEVSPMILKSHLTKHAPDGWDCARFWELFLNFGRFPFPSFTLPSRR